MGAVLFFSTLGTAGIAACFALGLISPLLQGIRVLRARMGPISKGQALSALVARSTATPLRLALSPAQLRFAADTRALLTNLEHACAHRYRFANAAPDAWWPRLAATLSGSTYAPTIGITGEAWRWLRQAETMLDRRDATYDHDLESVAAKTRALLFETGPWSERLDTLTLLVLRADAGLRAQSGAPYRDRVCAPVCPPHATEPGPDADASCRLHRQRQYTDALTTCDAAIRSIVRRFAAPADRDDLTQEIRIALWNALPTFRGDCSLRSYVLRIAKYRAINFKERLRVFDGAQEWSDAGPRPDEVLDERRQRLALGRAVRTLPATLREALEMRLQGQSYREIADHLAISEKNASVRVSRARGVVKRKLCPE